MTTRLASTGRSGSERRATRPQRPGGRPRRAGRRPPAFTPLYDRAIRLTRRERLFRGMLLEQAVADLAAGEVLDLGCGTGALSLALAARAPEAAVTVLDADPQVLAISGDKDDRRRVRWVQGSAAALPFDDGRFDRVVASLLLHHLSDADKLQSLREARRVLRASGRLHVADWGQPRGIAAGAGFGVLRLLDGIETTRLHAAGGLSELVARAGFAAVTRTGRLQSVWGTLELLRAQRA